LIDNEIAVNFTDRILYAKNPATGNIISITLGGSGGGGGSANIVEATTAAGFPATGADATLYIATDASRVYRWAGSVYVEIGTSGGGTDTVLRALFVPGAPTSVTASAGNAQASVSWTAPTGVISQAPITDYVVQYSSNSGASWTTFADGTATSTSATVTGLTNGTAYAFRVAAVSSLGQGAWSTASSAVTPSSFQPSAVILTSGSSYTVPSGAAVMKAWAIGAGGGGGTQLYGNAGGTAYKTWSVSGGSSVSYSLGENSTTVSYGGSTITATRGGASDNGDAVGTYSGGDGGADGGRGVNNGTLTRGGAVGGNGSPSSCNTTNPTDVSGLFAAVALAGGTTTDSCGGATAFGVGGHGNTRAPGIGGGAGYDGSGDPRAGGSAAVVLYFTLS
jgi:titin